LIVVDPVSGREVSRIGGMTTAGWVSWSSDGTRLQARDLSSRLGLHELSTGQNHLIPVLPGDPRPVRKGVPRVLGLADDDRMVVAVRRGRPPTVAPPSSCRPTANARARLRRAHRRHLDRT